VAWAETWSQEVDGFGEPVIPASLEVEGEGGSGYWGRGPVLLWMPARTPRARSYGRSKPLNDIRDFFHHLFARKGCALRD
jgi:hypothetical protein